MNTEHPETHSFHLDGTLLEALAADTAQLEERAYAESHLKACASCRRELEALRRENSLFAAELSAEVVSVRSGLRRGRKLLVQAAVFAIAAALVLAMTVLFVRLGGTEPEGPRESRLTDGPVMAGGSGAFLYEAASRSWRPLQAGVPLPSRGILQTAETGGAQVELASGAQLELGPGSVVQLDTGDHGTRVSLVCGSVTARGRRQQGAAPLRVELPDGQIRELRDGTIEASVEAKKPDEGGTAMLNGFRLRLVPAAVVLAASMHGGDVLGEEETPAPPPIPAPNVEAAVYEGKTAEEWVKILRNEFMKMEEQQRKSPAGPWDGTRHEKARAALSRFGIDVLPVLMKALKADSSDEFRIAILSIIGNLQTRKEEIQSYFGLLKDSNFEVRRVAIRLLSPWGSNDPVVEKAIRGMLKDSDLAVVEAAEGELQGLESIEKTIQDQFAKAKTMVNHKDFQGALALYDQIFQDYRMNIKPEAMQEIRKERGRLKKLIEETPIQDSTILPLARPAPSPTDRKQ